MSGEVTKEELIQEVDRRMDSGEQPFVCWGGKRWAFPAQFLEQLGLRSGQQVLPVQLEILLEAHMRLIKKLVEQQDAAAKTLAEEASKAVKH